MCFLGVFGVSVVVFMVCGCVEIPLPKLLNGSCTCVYLVCLRVFLWCACVSVCVVGKCCLSPHWYIEFS